MSKWRWIYGPEIILPDGRNTHGLFYNVGILEDGSLHNPNGYPEDLVRSLIAGAEERRALRRSEAAKQAAATRKRRVEKRITEAANRIRAGEGIGDCVDCYICGKSLSDAESQRRGIGPECWQKLLERIELFKAEND